MAEEVIKSYTAVATNKVKPGLSAQTYLQNYFSDFSKGVMNKKMLKLDRFNPANDKSKVVRENQKI